jgi:hypothetical protein
MFFDGKSAPAWQQPSDFKQENFDQFCESNEEPQYLLIAHCVEVTFLKILTELEAPLWSFKVTMELWIGLVMLTNLDTALSCNKLHPIRY